MSESNGQTSEVHKIEISDIEMGDVVGRGAFGEVRRGIWDKKEVAVKTYDMNICRPEDQNRSQREFDREKCQLSRVSHKNIVRLYAFAENIEKQRYSLILEYSESGSLYDVIHSKMRYNLWDALSWLLQIARGISYLHSFRPKPLLHRDIKSLNILLFDYNLKLCDFGSVRDMSSDMTEGIGTVAWMAPEVIMCSNDYTEKCDVYSYAIVLWELLSRRMPWKDKFSQKASVIWEVARGGRLPLFHNCPQIIEQLLTKCWSQKANERPSMSEVELTVQRLLYFCPIPTNEANVPSISSQNGKSLTTIEIPDQTMISQQHITCPEPIHEDFQLFKVEDSKLWPPHCPDITNTILNQRYEQIKRLHKFSINQYIEYLKMENELMVLLSDKQELNDSNHLNDSLLKENIEQRLEDEYHSLTQLIESLRTKFNEIRERHEMREDMNDGNWDDIQTIDLL